LNIAYRLVVLQKKLVAAMYIGGLQKEMHYA